MPQMASKVEMMYIKVGKDGMEPGEHEPYPASEVLESEHL